MIICGQCGLENPVESQSCRNCGSLLRPEPEKQAGIGGASATAAPNTATGSVAQTNGDADNQNGSEDSSEQSNWKMILGVIAVVIVLWLSLSLVPSWLTPPNPEVVLRLHGSGALNEKLIPELATEFLKTLGAEKVNKVKGGNAGKLLLRATFGADGEDKDIEILSHDSKTAFENLNAGKCDIAFSVDKVKMPVLTEDAHVLGMYCIAVIVNANNKLVETLSQEDIKRIFTGETREWEMVGGVGGEIKVFTPEDQSETFEQFKSILLKDAPLTDAAFRRKRDEDVSYEVSRVPEAIGFVCLSNKGEGVKAVAIYGNDKKIASKPDLLQSARATYPFKIPLYLYTPSAPRNDYSRKFYEFTRSQKGQEVVKKSGFMPMGIKDEEPLCVEQAAPPEYQQDVHMAKKSPYSALFKYGEDKLTDEARARIAQVVKHMNEPNFQWGKRIILMGFADDVGGETEANQRLSERRAKVVEAELKRNGVTQVVTLGFGARCPEKPNDSPENKGRNRRVEVWFRV